MLHIIIVLYFDPVISELDISTTPYVHYRCGHIQWRRRAEVLYIHYSLFTTFINWLARINTANKHCFAQSSQVLNNMPISSTTHGHSVLWIHLYAVRSNLYSPYAPRLINVNRKVSVRDRPVVAFSPPVAFPATLRAKNSAYASAILASAHL